ncbi:MAG: PIN domain-containing protein [Cyanobacteria bacterium J007]|nr:MAG: PIN domain-containing protein [Cyanobacteria bacterium J007]
MPINYNIQAEIVDLRSDTPKKDEIFLVDTNVWYWFAYTKASMSSLPYQTRNYPSYLNKARLIGSLLLYCGLSLAELAHNIERSEREIFNLTSNRSLTAKEYRHNQPTERANVVDEVKIAWNIVTSIAVSTDITIDETTTGASLTRLQTQPLDGYDLLILEAMRRANIKQVITDDGDYVTVPSITVFTENQNVIQQANAQGKLKVR